MIIQDIVGHSISRRRVKLKRYSFTLQPDNPQEQGITVAPLNVEVGYRSAGARRKSYLFPTTKVSQVLVDYALNKFKEQDG